MTCKYVWYVQLTFKNIHNDMQIYVVCAANVWKYICIDLQIYIYILIYIINKNKIYKNKI